MKNKKIVITGVTGLIALPVAKLLAADNEVWGLALFGEGEAAARASLEAAGVHCVPWNMANEPIPASLPKGVTHVMHTAMLRETESYDAAIDVNSIAVARIMEHFRGIEAFLFISSTAIYKHLAPDHRHKETDPLGGGLIFIPAYQISKIAGEAVVRSLATLFGIPTTIIRPGMCYGPGSWGGVPILLLKKMMAGEAIERPPEGDLFAMPIHIDDIARMTPALFDAAAVPSTIVNISGDEVVSDLEYISYIAELGGVPLKVERGEWYRDAYLTDNTKREAIAGKCEIGWREGFAATIKAHFPGL